MTITNILPVGVWLMSAAYASIYKNIHLRGFLCFRYEGHLESKERFAIQRYLLITGKKKNMQVL